MPDILHVTVKGVTYDVPVVGGGAVSSVNGQTGNVVLDADDVGALPDNTSIPTKTSDLTNDSGFITGYTETDPTVPAWAKASSKPSYTAQEVGALPNTTVIPTKVSDLQNDSGFITGYTETDPTVPSWAKTTNKPSYTASEVGAVPTTRTVNGKALSSNISLSASDVGALPSGTAIPSKTSDLTNDSGFITGYTETDPTVPAWAKAVTKPSYTAQEVGAIPEVDDVTLEDDATNGGVISLYDTNDTLRQKLDGNGKLWQYDGSGNERTYLEYGDIHLKDANEVTRQHLDSSGTLEQFDSSAVKRTRLAWGDLYLYDDTGAQTFHADDAGVVTIGASGGQQSSISKTGITLTDANGRARINQYGSSGGIWLHKAADLNTSVFIQDTSDVTRTRLSKDGLSFFNASGTKSAEYPADFPTWTYAFAADSGQIALVNCNGTVDKLSHIITIDTQNRIVGFSCRARITGFSRSGANPGFQINLSGDIGSATGKRTWYGGTVGNQNGTIPSETVYVEIKQGRLNILCSESIVNISGSTLYIIMPQTFLKY